MSEKSKTNDDEPTNDSVNNSWLDSSRSNSDQKVFSASIPTLVHEMVHESWHEFFSADKVQTLLSDTNQKLQKELDVFGEYVNIYPPRLHVFNAFALTPLNKLKVVLLGQDPYIRPEEAHGLSFSVQKGIKVPPSLRNIYKELIADSKIDFPNPPPKHGQLNKWAERGVLLLNSSLTVRQGKSGSHMKFWTEFTDYVIQWISENVPGTVFILLGLPAKKKESLIDNEKSIIIKAGHPSPLNRNGDFIGSRVFSKANDALMNQGRKPVKWSLK